MIIVIKCSLYQVIQESLANGR